MCTAEGTSGPLYGNGASHGCLADPFGVFASILSTNIHENAVYSHTEDLSDYGQWDAGVSDFEGMEVLPAREMVSDGALSYVYDEDTQGKTR